jgi:hypothetical protein
LALQLSQFEGILDGYVATVHLCASETFDLPPTLISNNFDLLLNDLGKQMIEFAGSIKSSLSSHPLVFSAAGTASMIALAHSLVSQGCALSDPFVLAMVHLFDKQLLSLVAEG